MNTPVKGDRVVTRTESQAFSDSDSGRSLSEVNRIPRGRVGTVLSVLTNAAGDGRTVVVDFDGEILYVREETLKKMEDA